MGPVKKGTPYSPPAGMADPLFIIVYPRPDAEAATATVSIHSMYRYRVNSFIPADIKTKILLRRMKTDEQSVT
jgi:hypothetical protein